MRHSFLHVPVSISPYTPQWHGRHATPALTCHRVARKRLQHTQPGWSAYSAQSSRRLTSSSAASSGAAAEPRRGWVAPLSLAPGALALLCLLAKGPIEAACTQANSLATLGAAFLFLTYFSSSLTSASQRWASQLASALRPAQDDLLHGCALAVAAQLITAAYLCASYPRHAEGALVPLYVAGYACLALLAATQKGRRLRGRVRMEIEAGEGERHSVMAQGTRLAARDYTWAALTLHLTLQTAAGLAAATATAGATLAAGAALQPLWLTLAYGVLAVLYGVAGACKYLPSLQQPNAGA